MPTFEYLAMSIDGKKQKGMLDADSLKDARRLLREKGFTLLHCDLAQKKHFLTTTQSIRRSLLTHKELALITRQFATLIAAGLPLPDVLKATAEQAEKTRTKIIITALRTKIQEGHTFVAALREFPHEFSELYCGSIASGE